MVIIKLDSREHLCDGVLVDRKHIHRLLRQMSLFMPDKMLKHWLKKYVESEKEPMVVSPAEFLCLAANASDRAEATMSLPYNSRDLTVEKDTGLYSLDPGVRFHHAADPERWMQREGNSAFSKSRVTYYRDADAKRSKATSPKRRGGQRTTVKERFEADLKALLANPALRGEIQTALSRYAKILPVTRAQTSVAHRKAEDSVFTPVIDMIHLSEESKRRRRAFEKKVQSLGSSLSFSVGGETIDAEGSRVSSRPVSGTTRPVFAQHRPRPSSAKSQVEPRPAETPARPRRAESFDRGIKKQVCRVPRWLI